MMQPTPSPHSFPLSLWPSSRFGGFLTTIGLSVAAAYGTVKVAQLWRDLQRAHEAVLEKSRRQEEELVSLRQFLKEKDTEVEQRKVAVLSHAKEVDGLRKRIVDLERERDVARQQHQTFTDQAKNLGSRNQRLEGELQRLKAEHMQTTQLLDVRSAELKGAQAFLTKDDRLSGADVIKLVEELNGEVMQTAASMAEELTITEKVQGNGTEEVDREAEPEYIADAHSRTEEIIGPRMTSLLKTSDHHEDPILVQIALQAAMAAYCHWIASSWAFESPEDEHMLSEVYARVREIEEQAVSGRWRQLTRVHLQRMLVHEPDLVPDMIDACAKIFISAGLKEGSSTIYQRISDRFGTAMSRLMTKAQQLNKEIGEGITSCDLEALYIAPDVAFNAMMMEDALGSPDGKASELGHEKILCTTDLGLVRAEKISGKVGEWREAVLLKPKVMLYSGIAGSNGKVE